jgi:molybdopterin-guanine dinucleotide biosynthesis protein B
MASKKAIAFTGPSGSGKTTLIEKISKRLSGKRKIAIIKHDPKDKAIFDQRGKDSDRFYKTGASVAVVSDTRTTMFLHEQKKIPQVADMFGDFDLLMVEGLKTMPLPRLAVFRDKIDMDYLPYILAIAIDESVDIGQYQLPGDLDILDLNDLDSIISWIDSHAITYQGTV